MPKFTVKELIEKAPSLSKIANPEKGTLDIYTSFRLKDLISGATKKLAEIEKSRHDLYELHGDKDEAGNIKIRKGEEKAFADAWDEFLTGEVVLPNVEPPIPLSRFAKVGLNPVDLMHLDFLLVGENEPEPK